MKTCAVCGTLNTDSAITCIACGEGSWAPGIVPKTEQVTVPDPEPVVEPAQDESAPKTQRPEDFESTAPAVQKLKSSKTKRK